MSRHLNEQTLLRINALTRAVLRDPQEETLTQEVSLVEILHNLREQRYPTGIAAEYLQHQARKANKTFDFMKPGVGFDLLYGKAKRSHHAARALTVGSGSAGGYVVATDIPQTVADYLRPWSIVARAGVTFLSGLRSNVALPRLSGTVTAYHLDGETASITDSGTETVTQVAVTPHNIGGTLKYSRQLTIQAPGAENMISTDLLRTTAVLVDTDVIGGTGTNGQPTGIALTPGISTQSLASATWANCVAMKTTLGTSNVIDDGTMAYIANPTVKGGLESRDRSTGTTSGRFIVEGDALNGLPVYASTVIPSGDMICARWSDVLVPVWGDGIELELTPYASASDFQSGLITLRAMLTFDVALRYPAAVVLGSSYS